MAIRSALGSVPALARSPSAAAAASGWRRLLSPSLHGDTTGVWSVKAVSHVHPLVFRPMYICFPSASAAGRSGWRRHLSTQSENLADKKEMSQLFEAALMKQKLDYDKKFNEVELWFQTKKHELECERRRDAQGLRRSLVASDMECMLRFRAANNSTIVLLAKHTIARKSKPAILLQAHISLLKGILWTWLTLVGGSVNSFECVVFSDFSSLQRF